MFVVIILFGSISMLAVIDLLHYLFYKQRFMGNATLKVMEVTVVRASPLIFLLGVDFGTINDCCTDSAFFSPSHRLTIYLLIFLSVVAYFSSSWRTKLFAPLLEFIVNCFLLIGIVLNVLISIHQSETFFWLLGNVPIIALFLTVLLQNHQILLDETNSWDIGDNFWGKIFAMILRSNVFMKYPLLLIGCLPLLIFITALLFVLGQKPDSAIKAFTETYKHGLSQLDYMCDNVECGGHYLCSVAANGHSKVVRPQRYGERNGNKIICNRQLLISNAFEELMEQRFPRFHKKIRKKYDRVGDFVHQYYDVFNNKFFSDFIYLVMKPLEWFFLVLLYLTDRKPENRIAQQYLRKSERLAIKKNCLKNG